MNVCVIGLGKIGLPLAVYFAQDENLVFGVDINPHTVGVISQGKSPFSGEKDLEDRLSAAVKNGHLKVSTHAKDFVSQSEVVLVVVPLVVNFNGEPDFESIDSVVREIASSIKPGTLVAFETTLPVGTTRKRFTPMIEDISGLKVGVDFNVVFSPERVFTGRIFEDLEKYPKIVGGVTKLCTDTGVNFYNRVLKFQDRSDLAMPNGAWPMESADDAEFVKLAETTYRDVNIGLANQFGLFAKKNGLDIYSIIEAANSQPYSNIHTPGISVGGHCIPVYSRFYLWSDEEATIVQAARDQNSSMPREFINLLLQSRPKLKDKAILLLGISYRTGVKEHAFSGAFDIRDILEEYGSRVFAFDPLYTDEEIEKLGFRSYERSKPQIDIVVLHTGHEKYLDSKWISEIGCSLIVDGRDFFRGIDLNGIEISSLGGH